MKDGLDRTGKKNRQKTAKIACTGMCHRMHFLDLQRLYVFWTAGLTTVGCQDSHYGCLVLPMKACRKLLDYV